MSYPQLGRGFLLLFFGLLPLFLVSTLLANLGSEFKELRHSLDQVVASRNLEQNQFPRPVTETVVVTTSVFTSPPSLPMGDTSSILPSSTLTDIPSYPPLSDLKSPSPTPPSLEQPAATDPAGHADSSSSVASGDSLFIVTGLPFEWTIPVDLIPVAQKGWNKIAGGLGVAWEAFRKIYHYPLDPP